MNLSSGWQQLLDTTETLKKMLYFCSMQVAAFGCHSFALLFDDIDPELSEADQSVFSSSACAQVSITNEVYEHLGQPKFLFCPTGQLVNL